MNGISTFTRIKTCFPQNLKHFRYFGPLISFLCHFFVITHTNKENELNSTPPRRSTPSPSPKYIPISVLINLLKITLLKAHFNILKSFEHMLISGPYLKAYLFVRICQKLLNSSLLILNHFPTLYFSCFLRCLRVWMPCLDHFLISVNSFMGL